MRYLLFPLAILLLLALISCSEKAELLKEEHEKECFLCDELKDKMDEWEKDDWDLLDKEEEWEKVIIEDLVKDEDCGCVVEGVVQFTYNSETVAIIKYDDKTCEGWASKILCKDGDCKEENSICCKFKQDCEKEEGK